jgi:hypothetical protein
MQASSFPAIARADHARNEPGVSAHQRALRVLPGDARTGLLASCEEW